MLKTNCTTEPANIGSLSCDINNKFSDIVSIILTKDTFFFASIADAVDKTKFEEDKTELNKQLWKKDDSLIILNKDICKSISFIVVRTDKQIEKMIKFIRNTKTIFGNSITQEEKDIIISKITSFEGIENNY